MELDKDLKSRQEARHLAEAAHAAYEKLKGFSQQQLDAIVKAMAQAAEEHALRLGQLAAEETGFGNARDKAEKNRFAAEKVYAAIKDLPTVGILHRDEKRKVWDVGVPVGVICAIVPSTNPTSTAIYKALICLKAGNPVVFSPHPKALCCTLEAVRILAAAAEQAGCPTGALSCLTMPTMEAVQELMKHERIRLILATGGPGMVHAAYSSGKPAIGVGAGNGPCYIHPSAEERQAVADILHSKTFDNGTICASEQSVVVQESNAASVKAEFARQGGYFLSEAEAGRLAKLLLRPDGSINPQVVGKTALQLAQMAQITVPGDTKVLIAYETQAGPTRPYSREKLCPVLAFFVEKSEDSVLRRAIEVLEQEGAGHTFSIHATDAAVIERFALQVPVSRFLVNTPSSLGGIGSTTGLFPALTLGCGAVGGSSSSNNIGPLDLVNIRRVAWGEKTASKPEQGWGAENSECHTQRKRQALSTDRPTVKAEAAANTGHPDSALIEELTQKILQRLNSQQG
ncbi:MAG: acetaldehyde dehydrogenase (acetylating) [Oscillospiraceae bacterium]|nr:acetaldehyde dehydrogenase (acetylating) [Oscillospiraceae bacterium]